MTETANILDPFSSADLVRSLRSTTCPACGKAKKSAQTLCRICYFRLPANSRAALYDRLGGGYREAIAAALDLLHARTFVMPAPIQPTDQKEKR